MSGGFDGVLPLTGVWYNYSEAVVKQAGWHNILSLCGVWPDGAVYPFPPPGGGESKRFVRNDQLILREDKEILEILTILVSKRLI